MSDFEIGFLGGGRMAQAIFQGLSALPNLPKIAVVDPSVEALERWRDSRCSILDSVESLFAQSKWVIWCIKPQIFYQNIEVWSKLNFEGHGWISIMAGVSIESLQKIGGPTLPVVRTMPNTPLLVCEGMVAISLGVSANEEDVSFVESLFKPVAKVLRVTEEQMDGVTAVSGSGPAYLFHLSEVIEATAKELGLKESQSRLLWSQTLRGAATMLESGSTSADLKNQVTSPGGTTQAALETFESQGFGAAFKAGLLAAKKKSIELSKS